MENCQVPQEPIVRKADKVFAYEILEYILILLKFSGHHFCDNKIYELSDNRKFRSNKKTIVKRLADEMSKHIESDYESEYVDSDENSYTYSIDVPDRSYYATVIPINNEFMLLFGRLAPNVDYNKLSDEHKESIDEQTRQVKKSIMFKSLNDIALFITGTTKHLNWKIEENKC